MLWQYFRIISLLFVLGCIYVFILRPSSLYYIIHNINLKYQYLKIIEFCPHERVKIPTFSSTYLLSVIERPTCILNSLKIKVIEFLKRSLKTLYLMEPVFIHPTNIHLLQTACQASGQTLETEQVNIYYFYSESCIFDAEREYLCCGI